MRVMEKTEIRFQKIKTGQKDQKFKKITDKSEARFNLSRNKDKHIFSAL